MHATKYGDREDPDQPSHSVQKDTEFDLLIVVSIQRAGAKVAEIQPQHRTTRIVTL